MKRNLCWSLLFAVMVTSGSIIGSAMLSTTSTTEAAIRFRPDSYWERVRLAYNDLKKKIFGKKKLDGDIKATKARIVREMKRLKVLQNRLNNNKKATQSVLAKYKEASAAYSRYLAQAKKQATAPKSDGKKGSTTGNNKALRARISKKDRKFRRMQRKMKRLAKKNGWSI